MSHSTTKAVSIKLDAALRSRLEALATTHRRTPHWLMREAIRQFVEHEEQRERFRQETLNAWEDYQHTGLHATAAEVQTWLESWGSEHELAAPICHP